MSLGELFSLLVSLVSIIGGLWTVGEGIKVLVVGPRELKWLQVPATIIESAVRAESGAEGVVIQKAVIRYRYELGGETFTSNKIKLLDCNTSFTSTAAKKVARYPWSREVVAYVNPDYHAEAVLEPGPQRLAALLTILAGILFIFMGCWMGTHPSSGAIEVAF